MRKAVGIVIALLVICFVYIYIQDQKRGDIAQKSGTEFPEKSELTVNIPDNCSGKALPPLTEGPYYTPNTPERRDIREEGVIGEPLILQGYVFDTRCEPISNAWIDFWQADGSGNYDNVGYNLRGHQYTDADGYYKLITVLPTRYSGRTEHIHFKIRASEDGPIITSQLFFPDSETNQTDSIFDENLIVTLQERIGNTHQAFFNFVIER